MNIRIPQFDGVRVLVAGDLMLDRYWFGATGRISPEAPEIGRASCRGRVYI